MTRIKSALNRFFGWLQRFPLRVQLNLVLGSVCFLCVFLLSLSTYYSLKEQVLSNYEASGTLLLQETINHINSKFLLTENIVYNMSRDSRILEYKQMQNQRGNNPLDSYFSNCIELTRYNREGDQLFYNSFLDDIFFITDTDIFLSRREHLFAYNIRSLLETDSFQEARDLKGSYLWTESQRNPTAVGSGALPLAEQYHFMYLSYIMDENFQYQLGYLGVSITLENLSRLLDDLNTSRIWEFYIIDSSGNILACRDRLRILEPFSTQPQTIQYLTSDDSGMFQGDAQYMYSAPLRINNWKLLITMPVDTAAAELSTVLFTSIGLGLLCLICLTGLSALVSSNVTKPLGQLLLSIRQIRDKNFTTRVSAKGCYEIAALSNEYCFMLAKLDTLVDEIKSEEKALQQAQLKTLRAQINPHFLYNTLDTIKWLILRGDVKQSEELVERLSSFFRIGLSGGNEEIPLSEEIRHVTEYLEIQKIRLNHRFDYLMDFSADITFCLVPKLILQPLAENAVLHGFSELSHHGILLLRVSRVNDTLRIQMKDNGQGMPPQQLALLKERLALPLSEAMSDQHGYAMRNIHQRLMLAYGSDFGIEITSEQGEGTSILITTPFRLPGE